MGKFSKKIKFETLIGWQRPRLSFVKMNVDGSAKGCPGPSAAGGVLRDHNGDWLAGFTFRVGISNSLLAELWRIYHGLLLCWSRGFRRVELESDSLVAVKKVQSIQDVTGQYVGLLSAIQELLSRDWHCSIRHVHREANACADWMATHFDSVPLGLHTFEDPTEGIAWPRAL